MTIITISRGSYSKGKEIAERVAEELGYECISRDILLEASAHYSVPEYKLVRALHDAPMLLGRVTKGREKYVAYIRNAFLQHVKRDNVVYHGLAGHFFLEGVDHSLKVRILADMESRIRLEMERENIPYDRARRILTNDDEERRKWAQALYGIDTHDPQLYDLVIRIRKVRVEGAVATISDIARRPHFQATDESRQALENLAMAALVKTLIVEKWPHAKVVADGDLVTVHIKAPLRQEDAAHADITGLVGKIEGIRELRVGVHPITFM